MRPLLNRSDELDAIDGALRGARSGRGSVMLIMGAAGIGKSRLIDAAELNAATLGVRSARASGWRPSRDPLGAMISLVDPLVAEADVEPFAGAAERARTLFGREPASEGPEDAFAVVDALHWLVSNLAENEPLVLLIDDLQWTDEVTIKLIQRLGEEIEELPLAILVGLRTGEPLSEDFGAALRQIEELQELSPSPLRPDAVSALVRDRLGADTSKELCDACSAASGGNPLLLRELLRAGREQGLQAGDAAAEIEAIDVVTLEGFVRDRVGRCSADAARLALTLAVLAENSDAEIVSEVSGIDGVALAEAAADLGRVELLDELTGSTIREPLLAKAVVACSTEEDVAAIRLAGAHALWKAGEPERAGAQLAELEGSPDHEPWRTDALLAAAEAASRGGSGRTAVAYLDNALAGVAAGNGRLPILLQRARVRAIGRDPGAVADLREALTLTDDPAERGRISLAAGQASFHVGRFEEATGQCRSAIDELGDDDRELKLLLEAEALNAERLQGGGRGRSNELLAEVEAGSSAGERAVLTHVAAELVASGEQPQAAVIEVARRAWSDGELIADVGSGAPVVSFLGTTLAWCEDFETVFELTRRQLNEGYSKRAPVTMSYALALRSGTRIRIGDLPGAEADAEQVVAALPASDPLAYMMCFGWMLESQLGRGRVEDASAALAASGLTGELPDLGTVDFLLLSRGDVKLASGEVEGAIEDYLEVGSRAERSGYLNPAGLAWRSRAASALCRAGEAQRARDLAVEEVDRARRFGSPRALGVALRALGGCLDDDSRLGVLEESVEILARSQAQLDHAGALVDVGFARLEAGSAEVAREALEQGMDAAHSCGAHPLVASAMDGLRAVGLRPRRPALRGVDALTTQQLRVARLAERGRTNREIAEELFLTRRTVELHLTGAYRKLGIEGREELSDALADTAHKPPPKIAGGLLCLLVTLAAKVGGALELSAAPVGFA